MGIYTSNRYLNEAHDWASEIPANEAYGAAIGCAQIMADCQQNDMALFESAIYSDFAEVKALQEGVGYVNENAFTNVIKKIVEMFKKLLAKIKGIFASFIAKLTGAFKNGKDLVKKYEKQIIKYSNWKDFKCKDVRVPKKDNIKDAIDKAFKVGDGVGVVNYEISISGNKDYLNTGLNGYGTEKEIHDAESSDIKEALLKKYSDGKLTDWDNITTDLMDELFDEKETIEGDDKVTSASYFSQNWIKTILVDDKWIKEVEKFNKRIEKNINTIIDNLNKDDDAVAKYMTDKDNKKEDGNYKKIELGNRTYNSKTDGKIDKQNYEAKASTDGRGISGFEAEKLQKSIHALQKIASCEQEVITKLTSEYMSTVKFTIAQARKVWTAAAAWSSGVHKESVEYAQALGESAAEQFYMNMEAVC